LSIVLLLIGWPTSTAWTLPLLFIARLTASYPARRTLYQETWSLGAYLSFHIRLTVAAFGFWILLLEAPTLIDSAGRYAWPVAVTLSAVLVAWHLRYTDAFGWLLRARAIDDPHLAARFAQLVHASGVRPPRFERVDMRGGVLANAVALPSLRQSAVVFSDTLLSRLDVDEIVAIGAHELAHLEHYNPSRLRRRALVSYAFIAAVALTPVFALVVPAEVGLKYAWPGLLLVALVARARNRQQNETTSDLRAVALTGDPEALVRGLTKLHAIARMPRRWDAQFERHATHPSLARRIKAIREAAGRAPATLAEAATFNAADGTASVIFRDDRVEWNEQALAQHTMQYAHLTELRLDVRHAGTPRLVAVDRGGHRWSLPLLDGDVARAQAVMDVVDVRTANPARPTLSPQMARLLAWSIAAMAATLGQFSVVIVALFAGMRPASPLLAAAGCATLAAGGLALRDPAWRTDSPPSLAILAALLGLALLWMARASRRDPVSKPASRAVAALGICAALSWAAALSLGFNAVRLHQAAGAWPATIVFSVAFAASTASSGGRRARLEAVGAAVAALLAVAAGSEGFLEAFSRDAFVRTAEPIRVRTLSARRIGEFSVPFDVTGLRLSPTGRTVALASVNEDGATFRLGPTGGPLAVFDADDAAFIDDDHVLLLERHPSTGAALREVAIGATSEVVFEHHLTDISGADLFFDGRTHTWAVFGHDRDGQFVRVTGTVGSAVADDQRWTLPTPMARPMSVISVSDHDAIVVETRDDGDPLRAPTQFLLFTWLFGGSPWSESHLWTIGAHGATSLASTELSLNCLSAHVDQAPAVCAAFDGTRTRFFNVDTHAGLKPVGWLSGRFYLYGPSAPDCVMGWWDSDPIMLRVSSHEALRIAPAGDRAMRGVAVTETVLATVTSRVQGSIVRLYEQP
jgi:Zn-dependent protease with chaperone function